ncbi:MAG: hypothetical protein DWI26_00185 [Planctomycetota bacterium]|nr:MAG: hypothetical protein DWI26_00185 [Planctomycetota bacterium]
MAQATKSGVTPCSTSRANRKPGGFLFESEARHHSSYVRLARRFQDQERVKARLEELALAESAIIDTGNPLPRMHS